MQVIKTILILLWKLWFLLVNIVLLPFIVPICVILIALNQYKIFYQTERFWAFLVFHVSGFYLKKDLQNKKLDSNQSYIIISNHTSMLDIMIMFILHPYNPLVFVGKAEVKRYPLLGYVFRRAHILVDRSDRASRIQVYNAVEEKINQGLSVCLFPEGGVPDESIELNEFRDGAFSMAIANQVPLVTYTLADVKKRFPFSLVRGKPGCIRIKQHPIIKTEELTKKDTNRIKEATYEMILKQLKDYEN